LSAPARPVLVLGTGAQAKYTLETAALRKVPVVGLLRLPGDHEVSRVGEAPVLGTLAEFEKVYRAHDAPHLLLACSRNRVKEAVERELRAFAPTYARVIHPSAVVATTARLGRGVIVNANAVVQPYATIGDHVMVHAGVVVEHDCRVEDFANLAPRVALAGHVTVGRRATLFTGAVVIPGVTIGADAVVGAGSVVLEDVRADATVVGAPAREIARRAEGAR